LVEHALRHAEQFAGSVSVFTSHPFVGDPSQSAHPALQLATVQVPFEHDGTALAGAHTAPQAPQLFTSRLLFVSHPSVGSPLQSPRGARHVSIRHTPWSHLAAALVKLHTVPQAPQFAASPSWFTSHPSAGCWLQSRKPVLQVSTAHAPATHWLVVFRRSHTNLHPPQLFASVPRFVSQPLAGFWSQSANPSLQGPRAHLPRVHPGRAFGSAAQAVPQALQFAGSFARSASQPSVLSALQSEKPALQLLNSHAAATHAVTVPVSSQLVSHAPQWSTLRSRFAQSAPQQRRPAGHSRPGAHPGTQ
jgi:hypothetical protein